MEEIIHRYLIQYPYLSNSKLAELIIQNENVKTTWGTLRHIISKYRSKLVSQNTNILQEPEEPKLPESLYQEDSDWVLSETDTKIAILNDIHIPFHDNRALLTALKYVQNWQPTTLVLNGDIIDCYAVSSYSRDPSMREFKKEVELTKQFFSYIREKFPETRIIYKFGNHENRLQFYLWKNAEEVSSLDELRLENLLQVYRYDIKHVTANQLILCGSLYIAHGHEIYASGGVINVARNIRLKAFDNIIFGHYHKTQEDIITTISGKTIGAWSVGCLCGLRPSYRPVSFWNHGFALVERNGTFFSIENKKIILDRVL